MITQETKDAIARALCRLPDDVLLRRAELAQADAQLGDYLPPEHPDCLRAALMWLAAQIPAKRPAKPLSVKHLVERWVCRYIGTRDVEVAAALLGIPGKYPCFHISQRITLPDVSRLDGIGQAFAHIHYYDIAGFDYSYSRAETGTVAEAVELHRQAFIQRRTE